MAPMAYHMRPLFRFLMISMQILIPLLIDYWCFSTGDLWSELTSECERRVRGASEISKFLRDTIVSTVIFLNLHLY